MNQHRSIDQTAGGWYGLVLRRLIHIGMIVYPILYLLFAHPVADWLQLSVNQLMGWLLVGILFIEGCRLRFGVLLFAQRRHERKHISSFAWGAVALCVVLLTLPDPRYAIPIVATCALGDPLLALLKDRLPLVLAMLIASVVLVVLWWVAAIWLPMPLWLPVLIAPLTVVCEYPNLVWIDDNALMQWVPLVFVLLFV